VTHNSFKWVGSTRPFLGFSLFLSAVLIAGCAGGGGSANSVIPSSTDSSSDAGGIFHHHHDWGNPTETPTADPAVGSQGSTPTPAPSASEPTTKPTAGSTDSPAPKATPTPAPTAKPGATSTVAPAGVLARNIDGLTIFEAGSYPFNDDVSSETATGTFNCDGYCTGNQFTFTQAYLLHIDNNTPNELMPVAQQVSYHVVPEQPFSPYTALDQITGGAGDAEFEAIDVANQLAYEVSNIEGTPPGGTSAFSGCVDTVNQSTPLNTNYGPCNGASGWHDNAIGGGLAPEEVTGVWPQPNGTVNHALAVEEPNCGGSYCGSAPQRIRLRVGSVPVPTDKEAYAIYFALIHYGAWTTDGGGYLSFSRLFQPQSGDSNFDAAALGFLSSLTANDFDVLPCQFESNGSTPSCP
jgi:hypothetical protein